MSKLSIYQNSWIDLVFEGKNKAYGAYQLRQENDKTTAIAFLFGLLLITAAIGIPTLLTHWTTANKPKISIPDYSNTTVQLSAILPNLHKKPMQLAVPVQKKTPTEVSDGQQLKDPQIVSANQQTTNIIDHQEPQSNEVKSNEGTTTVFSNSTANTETTHGSSTPSASGGSIETTFVLDKLPEFPGGINKFLAYVGNNFEKPELEVEKTIRIYVTFVIEKDGSMTDIQVRKDPGYGLGSEAIRVLKSLKTKWQPGMIAGQPVRTAYNLPIVVQMQ